MIEYRMAPEEAKHYSDILEADSKQTLTNRTKKYATRDDVLHNFRVGSMVDGSTMAQTAWHYMKKHFVSLLDKIERNDFSDLDDTKEKIQDMMNYLRFVWLIANEENNKIEDQIVKSDESK